MIWILLVLALFQGVVTRYLTENPDFYQLGPDTWESSEFRAMELGEAVSSWESLDGQQVAALMIQNDYDLRGLKQEEANYDDSLLLSRRPSDYGRLCRAYHQVFEDLKWFPVPASLNPQTPDIQYEDGWMEARDFPAENQQEEQRGHEGCDLMGTDCPAGFYPVVSISDGTIEKSGWLKLGGRRLGIRSPGGVYFYYAHLDRYSREWAEGDTVRAGELIGYMGDSGYGPEGTTGQFPVHLHLGIYLKTSHYDEMSINPYWLLRYLEKRRLSYWY